MRIILEKTAPNGAVAASHTIETLTIRQGQAVAAVESRTSADQLCWQEPVEIALTDLTGDPLSGAAAVLIGAGGYLEGGVIVADPTPLETLRLTMMSRVERLRDAAIHRGCQTAVGEVDTDDASIRNILGSVQTASLAQMAGQSFEIEWRMADNTLAHLQASAMIGVGVAVMGHVKACYARSWALKDDIAACETVEELEAIDLTTGWSD